MVESAKRLGQRRRFEIDTRSVVSMIFTGGWQRSKRRISKWEKEVEVLAKPNFRGPPQSGAQVRAKAKAGVDPLFIKRNHGINVGSRSATRCSPKAAQVTVDTVDWMSEDKIRWVPREHARLVSAVQMGAKKGRREARRQAVNCAGVTETNYSMECLVDCSGMAVPEHESVTNRRLGPSWGRKESRRDVDTLLRARARRLERHRHVSSDK
uniref:Uncharacterized protein n=1 Tax=Caenorhabditis japonica TaxID=281687 RepID=A0A8R1E5C7_CAEJA